MRNQSLQVSGGDGRHGKGAERRAPQRFRVVWEGGWGSEAARSGSRLQGWGFLWFGRVRGSKAMRSSSLAQDLQRLPGR